MPNRCYTNLSLTKTTTKEGFTTNNEITNDPIFGRRDRKTFNNTISAKYTFSVNASLSLTFRHNWSDVRYQNQFYDLGTDGYLIPNNFTENQDINFNSWNLDFNYFWQFAREVS